MTEKKTEEKKEVDITKFREVLEKHNLHLEDKAEEISKYLTDSSKDGISLKEFAKHFSIPEDDAEIILVTIYKGIDFKKNHIEKQ